MDSVKITIATFYAFGSKAQKAFINKTEEEINEDLRHICNSNNLISLENYSATFIDKKIVNEEFKIPEHGGKDREED